MDFSVVGHYTENSCVSGYFFSDQPVTHLVARSEEAADRSAPPVFLPVIAPPAKPSKPKIYRSEEEISRMSREREVCGGDPLTLPTLPQSKEGMIEFLRQADKDGKIVWTEGGDNSPIYNLLQNVIDAAPGDVHLLFGYDHEIPAHIIFFNELIDLGDDGKKLNGITHLALEMYGSDAGEVPEATHSLIRARGGGFFSGVFRQRFFEGDLQPFIDQFLRQSSQEGKEFFEKYVKAMASFGGFRSRSEQVRTLSLAAAEENNYKVIASDLSIREKLTLERRTKERSLQYAAREAFAVENVERNLQADKKEVIAYFWGLEHTEKAGLPRQVRCLSGGGESYSIALIGGSWNDDVVLDLVLRELALIDQRWEEGFALRLEGYREADLVIRLPYDGSRLASFGESKTGLIKLR